MRAAIEASGAEEGARPALRIPAPGLEGVVVGALQDLLRDGGRLLALMPGIDAPTAQRRIDEAAGLANRLSCSAAPERVAVAKTLIERAVVGGRIELRIRRGPLWGAEAAPGEEPLVIDVPATLKRCGGAVRLVVRGTDEDTARRPDARLIALLAKAQRWFAALSSGKHESVLSLAKEQGIASSDVTNVVHLAFLAPDLVQRIVEGDHPRWLGTKRLLAMAPLPLDWSEQRRVLGMAV